MKSRKRKDEVDEEKIIVSGNPARFIEKKIETGLVVVEQYL